MSEQMNKIESVRFAALAKVNKDYYDQRGPHYMDNEIYWWAVDTINRKCNEELSNAKQVAELLTNG